MRCCVQSGVCLFLSICNVAVQPTSQLAIGRVALRSLPCTARGEGKLRTNVTALVTTFPAANRLVSIRVPGRSSQLRRPAGLGGAAVSLPLLDIL